jgi:hypothetical protein
MQQAFHTGWKVPLPPGKLILFKTNTPVIILFTRAGALGKQF